MLKVGRWQNNLYRYTCIGIYFKNSLRSRPSDRSGRILENCNMIWPCTKLEKGLVNRAPASPALQAIGLTALGVPSLGVPTLTERLLCKLILKPIMKSYNSNNLIFRSSSTWLVLFLFLARVCTKQWTYPQFLQNQWTYPQFLQKATCCGWKSRQGHRRMREGCEATQL